MRVIADITDPDLIQKILDHIRGRPGHNHHRLKLLQQVNPKPPPFNHWVKVILPNPKNFAVIAPSVCKLQAEERWGTSLNTMQTMEITENWCGRCP